jgi:hypothetical protein
MCSLYEMVQSFGWTNIEQFQTYFLPRGFIKRGDCGLLPLSPAGPFLSLPPKHLNWQKDTIQRTTHNTVCGAVCFAVASAIPVMAVNFRGGKGPSRKANQLLDYLIHTTPHQAADRVHHVGHGRTKKMAIPSWIGLWRSTQNDNIFWPKPISLPEGSPTVQPTYLEAPHRRSHPLHLLSEACCVTAMIETFTLCAFTSS